MNDDFFLHLNRRHFFSRTSLGIGGAALASILGGDLSTAFAAAPDRTPIPSGSLGGVPTAGGVLPFTHFPPKAKRVIYLFMSGGPSQLDLYDDKPLLNKMNGQDLPESIRGGQRLTGMSANQATLPLAGSIFKFGKYGNSGATLSELLPHTARIADEICFVKSAYTEAINHDPAITFFQTGSLPARN